MTTRDRRSRPPRILRSSGRAATGRPNACGRVIQPRAGRRRATPDAGKALDLGCGEGADAIWLTTQGWRWRVTGVGISATATARAREAQRRQLGTIVRFVTADLAQWEPDDGPYDLVSASFLHSPAPLPRVAILQRAAATVGTGGHLVVVSHAAPPPWVDAADHPAGSFPSWKHHLGALTPATQLVHTIVDPAVVVHRCDAAHPVQQTDGPHRAFLGHPLFRAGQMRM
ncbi:class I SAM-dependent methyltransferase [Georgenia sp. TF02-10]|uniref:class I SAM-dependent methyltransferase n=1 Tax=Georgenia sp. TF02-10 TaxID=2917725 RepID=UPI001FA6F228|nr:class I SAM-dependent methyltransferase [Georgenia sp. TF02-10]UNX56534.1 class I SAM-dependent methyltransferase [Georgenia sp. TF02-10]